MREKKAKRWTRTGMHKIIEIYIQATNTIPIARIWCGRVVCCCCCFFLLFLYYDHSKSTICQCGLSLLLHVMPKLDTFDGDQMKNTNKISCELFHVFCKRCVCAAEFLTDFCWFDIAGCRLFACAWNEIEDPPFSIESYAHSIVLAFHYYYIIIFSSSSELGSIACTNLIIRQWKTINANSFIRGWLNILTEWPLASSRTFKHSIKHIAQRINTHTRTEKILERFFSISDELS